MSNNPQKNDKEAECVFDGNSATGEWSAFDGRSRRSEFWRKTFFCFILSGIDLMGIWVMQAELNAWWPEFCSNALTRWILGFVSSNLISYIVLSAVIVTLSNIQIIPAEVRRLHDLNMPGWWCIVFRLFSFTPLAPISGIAEIILLYCRKGTCGNNKYGPDPRFARCEYKGPLVKVEGLKKSFGSLQVLKGIDTTIERGEVIVIIGPSGGGKSTFLRCLNRLEKPTEGHVWFNGEEVSTGGLWIYDEHGEEVRTHKPDYEQEGNINRFRSEMGMVFQHFNLFPHLTILDNITLGPIKVRGQSRKEAEKRAYELLKVVGLTDKAHAYPGQLSGGQKQRIAIVRALAMNPDMMLFDEPTSALDPEMVGEVLEVMRNLAKTGMTMAIVTHEISFAREIASRVLFIDGGVIAVDKPASEFFGNIENPRLKDFLSKVL